MQWAEWTDTSLGLAQQSVPQILLVVHYVRMKYELLVAWRA